MVYAKRRSIKMHRCRKGELLPSNIIVALMIFGILATFFALMINVGVTNYGTEANESVTGDLLLLNKSLTEIGETFESDFTSEVQQQKEDKGFLEDFVNFVDKAFAVTFGAISLVAGSFSLSNDLIGEVGYIIGIPGWLVAAISSVIAILIGFAIIRAWRGSKV